MYRCTTAGASGVWTVDTTASVTVKKIAMFPIIDKADLLVSNKE